VPDFFRRRVEREMNSLHDGISFEKQLPVFRATVEHRTVIARADHDRLVRRQSAREAGDEFEFVHRLTVMAGTKIEDQVFGKLSRLNMACAAIGARRLSVRS